MSSKQSFESFIVEFKENRENVINILKIVLEQQKVTYIYIIIYHFQVEEFRKILNYKKDENQLLMKEFIKSKYYEFVESIENINNCKSLIKFTDEVLLNLEDNIQVFIYF